MKGSMSISLLILCLSICIPLVIPKKLEFASESELKRLINTEKNVIVLFTSDNKGTCGPKCVEFEHELAMGREVLVDQLNAWVVKSFDVDGARKYNPVPPPAPVVPIVVYFRSKVPLLYHGPSAEEEIVAKITRAGLSERPLVVNLDDSNFEHLTQASTGATTGDWFVMFYKGVSPYTALWQAVGLELQAAGRVNVAQVDRSGDGGVTARRFDVPISHGHSSDSQIPIPTFLFFRHGKIYEYDSETLPITVDNLVHFATDFWRNSKGRSVPAPKSPFDDLVELIAEKLHELSPLEIGILVGSFVFILVSGLGYWIYSSRKSSEKPKRKKIVIVKKRKDGTIVEKIEQTDESSHDKNE